MLSTHDRSMLGERNLGLPESVRMVNLCYMYISYLYLSTCDVREREGYLRRNYDFPQFQKLLAFLLPIFRNVDGSWRVTSKLRGSTLIQVARRRLKVLQRFSAILVRVGDVQGVSRRHAVRGKKVRQWCTFGGR